MRERRRGFRAALSHRDYRLLFAGRAVSSTGDWLYNVALIVLVLERTGSPSWVAVLTVCKLAPFALSPDRAGPAPAVLVTSVWANQGQVHPPSHGDAGGFSSPIFF